MSNWREQLTQESESRAVIEWLTAYYHIPTLLFVIGFGFWNRFRNWQNFIVDGQVLFAGNDPWYHFRSTMYTVKNFPATMPFDPWTQYPKGTFSAQFGTLFDQIVALIALIVGFGSPSESTVRFVLMVMPPFFGVVVGLLAYVIGRRIGGRFAGIIAAGFMAFAPDRFLIFSSPGYADHHVAETLFMSLAVLAVMIALTSAEKNRPVYELVRAREFDTLRSPVGWSLLAGVAAGMYLWVWPPGVWLYGILGVFFVIHMSLEHLRGQSPEHPAFVGVITMLTSAVMQISVTREFGLSATGRSLLQPGLGIAVAVGLVFLAWLSREVDSRDLPSYGYPGVVAGSILISAGLFALVLPDTFGYFLRQVDRVLGFITPTSAGAGTVGEAQQATKADFDRWYSFANYTALLGAFVLIGKQVFSDEQRGEYLLILVWAAFMVVGTLTQRRFGYYLVVPIGALNAAIVGFIMQAMTTDDPRSEIDIEVYQILTVVVVVLLMFAPMLGAFPLVNEEKTRTAGTTAASAQPTGVLGWDSSLDWLNQSTPAEGQYANPGGEKMQRYKTYKNVKDYQYKKGSYGVLSWWDYGHWITAEGQRIPNANPFQQGIPTAANFLLAQNESQAQQVLETRGNEKGVENAKTRYVMVDWKMTQTESLLMRGGKFFAPIVWADNESKPEYYTRIVKPPNQQQRRAVPQTLTMLHKQKYYNSMAVRLYHYHGSAKDVTAAGLGVPIMDWRGNERGFAGGETRVRAPEDGKPLQFVRTKRKAKQIVKNDSTAQIGGLGPYPTERVPALEHYRLVQMSDVNALGYGDAVRKAVDNGLGSGVSRLRRILRRDATGSGLVDVVKSRLNTSRRRALAASRRAMFTTTPAWTKVFERVPGATVKGSGGPANAALTLRVEMKPQNGQTFTYKQRVRTDENGNFKTTVPYSTTGYDKIGVEDGYSEVSVRVNGSYQIKKRTISGGNITVYSASFDVTESQVVGEDSSPVTVKLEKKKQELQIGGQSGDDGNGDDQSSDGTGSDGTGSDGTGSDGTGSDGTDSESSESSTESVDPLIGFTPVQA